MTNFSAYATRFELHPETGAAFDHLSPLISKINRVNYVLRVDDPKVNQGQMVSDFDKRLEQSLHKYGAKSHSLSLPSEIPQEFDFTFKYARRSVAVEIEKTNREKILRDILKCHMYIHAGVDFAVVGLPKNYPHSHGTWNLFEFGKQRFDECRKYGFGVPSKLGRVLLVGFEQFDAATGEKLSKEIRQRMRDMAAKG
jgi:hypothetical protein